jgi:hypothetical protein
MHDGRPMRKAKAREALKIPAATWDTLLQVARERQASLALVLCLFQNGDNDPRRADLDEFLVLSWEQCGRYTGVAHAAQRSE